MQSSSLPFLWSAHASSCRSSAPFCERASGLLVLAALRLAARHELEELGQRDGARAVLVDHGVDRVDVGVRELVPLDEERLPEHRHHLPLGDGAAAVRVEALEVVAVAVHQPRRDVRGLVGADALREQLERGQVEARLHAVLGRALVLGRGQVRRARPVALGRRGRLRREEGRGRRRVRRRGLRRHREAGHTSSVETVAHGLHRDAGAARLQQRSSVGSGRLRFCRILSVVSRSERPKSRARRDPRRERGGPRRAPSRTPTWPWRAPGARAAGATGARRPRASPAGRGPDDSSDASHARQPDRRQARCRLSGASSLERRRVDVLREDVRVRVRRRRTRSSSIARIASPRDRDTCYGTSEYARVSQRYVGLLGRRRVLRGVRVGSRTSVGRTVRPATGRALRSPELLREEATVNPTQLFESRNLEPEDVGSRA